MTKRVGARQLILAVLLPGAALVLAGVCEADFIFHVANYTYLHEEDLPLTTVSAPGISTGMICLDFVWAHGHRIQRDTSRSSLGTATGRSRHWIMS